MDATTKKSPHVAQRASSLTDVIFSYMRMARCAILPVRTTPGGEAVAAVDRLVAARLERHFGRLSALAARGLEHLASAASSATTAAAGVASATTAAGSALRLAGRAAFRAAIRLVLEAFARKELLLSGTKNKLAVAINAA
jgi:hypothetical protein